MTVNAVGTKNKSKGDVETWGFVLNRVFKESLITRYPYSIVY